MRTMSKALLATAALAIPGVTLAEGPAWTYGQVGYLRADSVEDATDAFNIKGSLGFADNFHFQAEYIDGDIGYDSDVDFDGYTLTLGANPSVGDSTDAMFGIRYFDLTYDDGPDDIDVDGFGVGVGLRHMFAENVELSASAWWNEGEGDLSGLDDDADVSDISLELGGRYFFNDNISAGVTVITNDTKALGDSATIDVRYQFADLL